MPAPGTAAPRAGDYDALSFDCYGTLIDWGSGLIEFLKPALRQHDVHVVDDFLLEFFAEAEPLAQVDGRRYADVLREVLRHLGRHLGFTPDRALLDAFAASPSGWPPFADTQDALRRLGERFQLAIISNVDNDLFAATTPRLGMVFAPGNAERVLVTAEQVGAYKPDPRMFAAARAAVGEGRRLLHVAQSVFHDIAPAAALGWDTVWIRRPRNAARAISAKPTWTFDSLAAFADAILAP